MRRTVLVLACALAALAVPAPAPVSAEAPSPPATGSIRRDALLRDVTWLASPARAGRLAGGPGYMRAARWAADRFRRLGLEPGGDDAFLQRLEVEYEDITACALAIEDRTGRWQRLRHGPDFTVRGLSGTGDVTAPVVFVGYGLSRPASGYDDYAGLDVRGKVVLAFKEEPPFTVDSTGWGRDALPRPKARTAAAHGAVALLLVPRPVQPHPQRPIASMLEGPGPRVDAMPGLQVDTAVAESLMGGTGASLADAQRAIDSTRVPRSRSLDGAARVMVRARHESARPSANVVAVLRGSDPALAGESVVLGAHLDHVGAQAGLLFPGANDNASGAAAVLAIAEAFARAPRPPRTVVFALFSSEESGLQGARRFVAAPPVPLEGVRAMFNLDCVGHGDSIQLGGGSDHPRLWQLARMFDAGDAALTIAATWGGGGADATPFHDKGVPTLYFASSFSYTHLHQTSDTPATLNPRLLEAVARLAYRTAWQVANGAYSGE